jgi:hypothetical protein
VRAATSPNLYRRPDRAREERATFAQETWPMATQENATSQFTLPRRKSAQPASRIFNYFIHLLAIRWPRKLTALATPLLYLFSFWRSPPFRSISLQFSYFQKWNNARAQRAKGMKIRAVVFSQACGQACSVEFCSRDATSKIPTPEHRPAKEYFTKCRSSIMYIPLDTITPKQITVNGKPR